MRKVVALGLVFVILLFSMLTGCGNSVAKLTEPTETTETPPTPVGTLYVSFGAALEIVYDDAGNALELTGVNDAGKELANAKQDQLNKGCVYTLRSILRHAITNELLGDAKTVAVRIGANDPLPADDFLSVIVQDCQYLVDEELAGVDMVGLAGDKLDQNGNLTYDTAKELAGEYLGIDAVDLSGEEIPVGGVYTFTGGDRSCTVDAFTGLVIGQ